jgi:flagellar biosynthetic protein FliR
MNAAAPIAFAAHAVLLTLRIGAALRLTPFFGGHPMPILPCLALSASLGVLLVPYTAPLDARDLGMLTFTALGIKEIFIGVVIGTLTRMAFAVFELAGGISHFFAFAALPGGGQSPLATLYLLVGTGAFLVLRGHHGLIRGLAATIRAVSPLELPGLESLAGTGQDAAVHLFAAAMATAVLVAAPIFVAGLFAEVLVGVISRFVTGATSMDSSLSRAVAVQLALVASLGLAVVQAGELLQRAVDTLFLGAPR